MQMGAHISSNRYKAWCPTNAKFVVARRIMVSKRATTVITAICICANLTASAYTFSTFIYIWGILRDSIFTDENLYVTWVTNIVFLHIFFCKNKFGIPCNNCMHKKLPLVRYWCKCDCNHFKDTFICVCVVEIWRKAFHYSSVMVNTVHMIVEAS